MKTHTTLMQRFNVRLLLATCAVVGLLIVSLLTGEYDIFSGGEVDIFGITRIPRTVALVLAGAAMSMSGLVMQMITQNRFVEPTTTGTTEWAGLGLLFCMLTFPQASILDRMLSAVLYFFCRNNGLFPFLTQSLPTFFASSSDRWNHVGRRG